MLRAFPHHSHTIPPFPHHSSNFHTIPPISIPFPHYSTNVLSPKFHFRPNFTFTQDSLLPKDSLSPIFFRANQREATSGLGLSLLFMTLETRVE